MTATAAAQEVPAAHSGGSKATEVAARRRSSSVPSAPLTYETIAEAAQRTGVSTKTIRRRIAEGRLTGYRFGPTLIRLNPVEVDGLLRPIPSAA